MPLEEMRIAFDDEAQVWRLARGPDEGKGIDEVVFTATGALTHINLPPVLKETM